MTNIKSGKVSTTDIAAMDKQYRICLINSLLGYKSLNLLGTISEAGTTNLCVISSAFHLGANPPLIGMVMRPAREHNDTLRNIKATGQFTLNNVLPDWYKQAHQTSASYPSGVSEFGTCGFDEHYVAGFNAPFVAQSTVRVGLQLREIIPMEINQTSIVIGEIVEVLVNDALIGKDGTIDHVEAKTVTVAGLDAYFLPQSIARLAYAKPGIEPQELNQPG
ncbi:flavin reductase family protein [Dyadobacter chenhuakuii]|uniref:Flavin reductase n=1 Tax=Dyadobacter chenhuakuii TaxID=2909339 RepID=A0A9X1QAK0_9BACT|nr:flavin reductase [Dyadobacter chenhuakuii]MCF2498180.1 flavin reductase [Dyadobacter chenhuakuii]